MLSWHVFMACSPGMYSWQIPDDWKKARVTPIFKNKGSNIDPNNYRPISVIGHISKCFEKMVNVQFREYLLAHAFITQSQSAFMKHHPTQTSRHHVIDSFSDNINHGELTGVYLFDLAKCFDTMDQELLLYKLGKYGLTDTELLWFSNYLSVRSQIVNINGQLSSPKRATRIVTQNFNWDESSINIIRNLGWQTIRERYEFLTCCITYKARNNLAPNYISDLFSSVAEHHSVLTRGSTNNNLYLPKPNLTIFKSSLSYSGANLWNSLPMHIRDSPTCDTLKSRLKKLQKSKPPV